MEEQQTHLFELNVDSAAQAFLREASKWAKFLAILGFIFEGLIAILGFFAGAITSTLYRSMGGMFEYSQTGGFGAVLLYLAIAVVAFFPTLYLFQFATHIRKAVDTNDQESLTFALGRLKSVFKFRGILAIIGISIWLIAIVAVMIGAMLATRG
ncbi:MAG TPA: DUF5362 family protein [Dinghuibacter sp.]|uniref:DUF5362 family protein n=1 Tax=Dinghuibacter sp. TaxID=2024697 RepID=UPI002D038DA5|nr:DUF5362 family protein [Dinghuibacter sp.]HTJ10503.1 DUF5362 family protein [Dinghuibacter sp.]